MPASPKSRLLAILALLSAPAAFAQSPTAFTYQADLTAAGLPATGPHDIRFRLFDAATGGIQLGPTLCLDDLPVQNGRFTASLDFGNNFFTAPGRHLEIEVRPNSPATCADATGFTLLTPRQPITAAPSAMFATLAGSATTAASLNNQPPSFYTSATNLATGTLSDARLSSNVPLRSATSTQTFSGTIAAPAFSGSGAALTNLNAGNLATGTLADDRLSTNIPRKNTGNTFTGQIAVDNASGVIVTTDTVPNTALRLAYVGSNPSLSATGLNTSLFLGTSSAPGAFKLDTFGRIAIGQTLHIGSGSTTNDDLRITGDGTLVNLILESGGTDQIAEIAMYENTSNSNGIILREDGRSSANALIVIDLSASAETTLATFDRDDNSFSAPIKAFRIDHPLDPANKELWHSCVESPDMLNIYSGTITTDAAGYATVVLPPYFAAANTDPRYQLTVIDDETAQADAPDRKSVV